MMSEPRHSRLGSERTGSATFVAILVALGCSPGRGTSTDASPASSGARQFYSLAELPTLRITIADKELDKLARKPRKLVRGSLTYRNTTVGDIGVRLKGHRSMRSLDRKAAFKLRFDKYVPGQRWLGMRRLTLNNRARRGGAGQGSRPWPQFGRRDSQGAGGVLETWWVCLL